LKEKRFMKSFVSSAVVLAFLAAGAPAQTPSQPQTDQTPRIQAGTEEVMVDVVVRDKKGKLLTNLEKNDFTVSDNGQVRPIKSFRLIQGTEAIGGDTTRGVGPTRLDPLRQIRLITLVFQGIGADSKKPAHDAAMELLKSELAQNVYVSVMYIDHNLEAIQQFTNDRDLLKKAIDIATTPMSDHVADNTRVRQQLAVLLGRPEAAGDASVGGTTQPTSAPTAPSNGPGAGAAMSAAGAGMAAAAMQQMMYEIVQTAESDTQTDWARGTVYPLLDLVRQQYRLPGRKTILYFSGGFPLDQSTEDAFKAVISTANRANVSFYCVDTTGLTTWSSNQNSTSSLNEAARRSAMNVGTSGKGISMDQAGAEDAAYEAGMKDTQNNMLMLSEQTGGQLIANTNDFRAPIRRVVEDAESYYEITYNPEIQKYDGSFRKISVKTTVKDAKVQNRSGYFALPPNMTNQVLSSFEVPLLQALDEKPLARNFPFQSGALHFHGAQGPTCEVVVDIPVSGLTLEENKQAGTYEGKLAYVAIVKDSNGQVIKKLKQEVPLRPTADILQAYKAASHFISHEGFALPPGRYTLETAVMDEPAKKISARKSSFVVPAENGQLGISSVTLFRSTRAKDASTKPDDPMLMADKVITPVVNATLKKADTQTIPFYVTIYPDRKVTDKPTLRMEFSKDGTPLGAGSAPLGDMDAQGRIQYVANAPMASLAPGNYQVRFVTKQGSEEADETVTFTIE
jgi:VWFA-related protein